MAIGDIIVGIDIGTSKVSLVIGEVNNFNQIEVICTATHKCSGIKKGKIIDENEIASSIHHLIKDAEEEADIKINSAYVTIPGKYITIVQNSIVKEAKDRYAGISAKDVVSAIMQVKDIDVPEGKQIIDVVDLEPIITKTQLDLAEYIKKDTVCPLIRAINLMVPDILLLKPTKYIKVNDYQNLDANLAEAFKGKNIITYTSALAPYTSKIKKAIDNHLLEISYDAIGLNAVKQVTKYVLDMNKYYMYIDNFRSDIQPLIRMLEGLEPLTKIEISDRIDLSIYTIQKMIKLELLVPVKQRVSRIKIKEIPVTDRFIKANSLYDNTVTKLTSDHTKPSLWCPSSIIETEMVIERIIRNNVEKNQNTLIICPDILSSYRMASVVRKKTNLSVAILNSNLSKGEYYDTATEIKNNNYRVVVTTTKGAFVDYPNLKTVILLDSENDNYYNDQSPRYNLKKIMMKYQELINCELIFHSYSPLLEDYILGVKGYLNIFDNKIIIAIVIIPINKAII